MAIPFWLARFGAVKASKAAMLFHACALLCMGVSSLLQTSFWLFLVGSALLGMAMGIQSVTVNLIVSKVSTPFNSSRLFSGLHSMYGLASLGAPLLLGAVFRFGLAWEWVLISMALIPMGHFVYYHKLPALDLAKAGKSDSSAPREAVIRLGLIFSFYVATEILISSRLVAFLYDTGSIDLDMASYGLTGFFLLLLGGRLLFSFYTPPFRNLALLRFSAFLTLILYLMSLLWHPAFIIFTGASISYFFPFGMNYIKSRYRESEAIIARVMMFVGAMLAAMHFAFGMVSDVYGIACAMWIGIGLISVVLSLLLLERD